MEKKEEILNALIRSIHINKANFDYCAKNKIINGTLYLDIKRIVGIYAASLRKENEELRKENERLEQGLKELIRQLPNNWPDNIIEVIGKLLNP